MECFLISSHLNGGTVEEELIEKICNSRIYHLSDRMQLGKLYNVIKLTIGIYTTDMYIHMCFELTFCLLILSYKTVERRTVVKLF